MHKVSRTILVTTGILIMMVSTVACTNKNNKQNELSETGFVDVVSQTDEMTTAQVTVPDYSSMTTAQVTVPDYSNMTIAQVTAPDYSNMTTAQVTAPDYSSMTIAQVTAPDYNNMTVANEIILNLVCETDMPLITQVFFNNPDSDKNINYSQLENMSVDDICNLRFGIMHVDGIFCKPESLGKLRKVYTFLNEVELKNEGLVYVTVCMSSDKEEQFANDKFAFFLREYEEYEESEQQTENPN